DFAAAWAASIAVGTPTFRSSIGGIGRSRPDAGSTTLIGDGSAARCSSVTDCSPVPPLNFPQTRRLRFPSCCVGAPPPPSPLTATRLGTLPPRPCHHLPHAQHRQQPAHHPTPHRVPHDSAPGLNTIQTPPHPPLGALFPPPPLQLGRWPESSRAEEGLL